MVRKTRKKIAVSIVAILVSVLVVTVPLVHPVSTQIPVVTSSQPTAFLNMTILQFSHTNTTSPNPNGCYNVVARTFISWNGTGPYSIVPQDFFLANSHTPVVNNSTATAYLGSNNLEQSVFIFPVSPVILRVSFTDFCIGSQQRIGTVYLYYFDGITQFSTQLS